MRFDRVVLFQFCLSALTYVFLFFSYLCPFLGSINKPLDLDPERAINRERVLLIDPFFILDNS